MTHRRWLEITEWPLAIAAFVFLAAYSWEVIGNLKGPSAEVPEFVTWIVWVLFVVDYVVNLVLAEQHLHWFLRHIPDLLIVALPVMRPLRLLRLVSLFRVLQRRTATQFRGQLVSYVVVSAVLLVYIGALAELESERNAPGAVITNFGNALWWAVVTISTVGYGDYYPVTVEGRMVAVAMMVSGIALLGVVTATLASWFVERVSIEEKKAEAITRKQVANLAKEIKALRADLAAERRLRQDSAD